MTSLWSRFGDGGKLYNPSEPQEWQGSQMKMNWKERDGFRYRKAKDGTTIEHGPQFKEKREVRKLAKLRYIKPEDIPEVARIRPSQGKALLDEFNESGKESATIDLEKDEKARSIGWSVRRAIKASKAKVIVSVRGGNIYLQREHSKGKSD